MDRADKVDARALTGVSETALLTLYGRAPAPSCTAERTTHRVPL